MVTAGGFEKHGLDQYLDDNYVPCSSQLTEEQEDALATYLAINQ